MNDSRASAAVAGNGRQHGAALLMAMLTVALVTTLAAGALWHQWRSVEIEASERTRVQAGWILSGALDWARLILREDARTGGVDHLGEPWNVALSESRLSSFLAIDRNNTDLATDAYLSGHMMDAQSRMNVMNLVAANQLSEPDVKAFVRLFESLGLEPSELENMAGKLRAALDTSADAQPAPATALLPRRVAQLRWLGLSDSSLLRLAPHITVLPSRTPLNLNTAGAEVIAASIPGLDLAGARQLLSARERTPFRTLADARKLLPAGSEALNPAQFSVATRFFNVSGRLRMEQAVVEEQSLVQRNGLDVRTLWRERAALVPALDIQAPR